MPISPSVTVQPLKCVIAARIKWKVTASDACRARAATLGIWHRDERACIQVYRMSERSLFGGIASVWWLLS
jgi:hypothetical protein